MNEMYEIGYPVYVTRKNIVVTIEESEIVEDTLLFYTSDGLCYAYNELTFLKLPDYQDPIQNMVKTRLMECFTKESLLLKQIEIKKRLSEYDKRKTTTTTNLTFFGWLRKVLSNIPFIGRRIRN